MTTQVVHVASETDDVGLIVTITVRRVMLPSHLPYPRASDVPPDLRDALLLWLGNVPKEGS